MLRQKRLAARRIVFDNEGVRDAQRAPVGQAALEGVAKQGVDAVGQRVGVEKPARQWQLGERDVGRRVVEVPLRRPAARASGPLLRLADDVFALLRAEQRLGRRVHETPTVWPGHVRYQRSPVQRRISRQRLKELDRLLVRLVVPLRDGKWSAAATVRGTCCAWELKRCTSGRTL